MAKKPVTPPNAEFVGRVVSDAKNPPETRMLTGWFGDAAEEGYRRLYTDAELSAYVDIPTDAILYTEPIRDVQPSGGVFVWVKRDAALKPGGSAASRAARFLQGQVQQDFSSPEKAGFRCITEVPCGEPTGFTGQCTKQPEVGGAWPCITSIPHCAEPTGFTGQCTHQPWPLPTRYFGCTVFHCPTHDLTHIPRICTIVQTGVPGCAFDPRGGGIDLGVKAGASEEGKEGGGSPAERAAVPPTSLPGCGYTETWGLCETQLLGCGFTKQWGQQCPTQLPGCGWTQQWGLCQRTQPPKCNVSVDIPCIPQTETPQCQVARGGFAAFGAAARGPGGVIDTHVIIQCNPSAIDACPTHGCTVIGCETEPPTRIPPCTQVGPLCPTEATICTQTGPQCPTSCGPACQTQQLNCTQVGEVCLTRPVECTQFDPKCPTVGCTHFGPGCPVDTDQPQCITNQPQCFLDKAAARAFGAAGPIGPTAYRGCTQYGPQCLTYPNGDCTFFGCPTDAQARAAGPGVGCTQSGPQCPTHAQPHCTCAGPGCPPTPATVCTQSGPQCPTQFGSGCPTDAQLDCTFGCTQMGTGCPVTSHEVNCNVNVAAARAQAFGPVGPIGPTGFRGCTVIGPNCPHPTIWTQIGPRCVTYPSGDCTFFGCPPFTRTFHCGGGGPSAVDACPTRFCPLGGGVTRFPCNPYTYPWWICRRPE